MRSEALLLLVFLLVLKSTAPAWNRRHPRFCKDSASLCATGTLRTTRKWLRGTRVQESKTGMSNPDLRAEPQRTQPLLRTVIQSSSHSKMVPRHGCPEQYARRVRMRGSQRAPHKATATAHPHLVNSTKKPHGGRPGLHAGAHKVPRPPGQEALRATPQTPGVPVRPSAPPSSSQSTVSESYPAKQGPPANTKAAREKRTEQAASRGQRVAPRTEKQLASEGEDHCGPQTKLPVSRLCPTRSQLSGPSLPLNAPAPQKQTTRAQEKGQPPPRKTPSRTAGFLTVQVTGSRGS